MRPFKVILTLETMRDSLACPLSRNGVDLSRDDTTTTLEVYQQWLLLMVDLGYLTHDALLRDGNRLFTDMVERDVLDLNNAFSELAALIKVQSNNGFKARCKRISAHLYNLIKDDVRDMVQGSVYAARRLLQMVSFTGRLTLNDLDLTQQCLGDYMRIESEISDWLPIRHVTALNEIIKRWLRPYDRENLFPNHGPGGVAGHGKVELGVKYRDLTSDALLAYAFPLSGSDDSDIVSNLDRISQTIFVPKNYKTFRTISMEPSTLQYYQQGVWKEIDRVVSSSYYLRARIGFHEQERNQILAREGSLERNYATIDLSAASDSVSYNLVKRCFRGTKVLRDIVATRSRRTLLPDGRLVVLKKFAPMGSALCFPIETLIFAAICQYVTREHGVAGDFSVFGDDIIVPTQCVDDINYLLEVLGFSVNTEKSFTSADVWYRESCGAEFCDGFDVTPLRISRNFTSVDRLARFESHVAAANGAYERGYKNLRAYYINYLHRERKEVLFSPVGLVADNYTNYHTRRRWNSELQRIECKVTTLQTKLDPGSNEVIRYRHWLESTRERAQLGDGFFSNVGRETVTELKRWMKKPYEESDQPFIDYFTIEEKTCPSFT